LAVTWFTQPQERFRAFGLLMYLAGFVSLALAIGYGRSGFGPESGLQVRYTILAAPALCCLYFIWEITHAPLGQLVQMGLFILWCVVFLPNFREAREAARARQEQIRALDEDVNRGVPPSILAEWHAEVLTGSDPLMIGQLPEGMRQLQRIGNPH